MRNYLFILLLVVASISCRNNKAKDSIKPKRSDITESVYASVKVSPEVFYSPQSVRSGIIDKIFITEGDSVKKGQLLFQIIPNTDVSGQLANDKISLDEAKSNYLGQNNLLNNIELEIANAKEQLDLDYVNLKRQERLFNQKIGKKIDYDQIKLKYDNSAKQLELLEQKFKQTKTTLKSNYQKALNKSKTGKNELKDFNIFAKMDGKVYAVNKEEGDYISAQEKFAEIGSFKSFKIEMDIDEVDITKVVLGDTVIILLDAYDEEVFLATVNKIFPKKDNLTQTFKVESKFIEQPPKLYYGLAGEANIVVSKRKNAIVIPTDYLLTNNKVLTPDGEKSVKVGIKNLEFVEILSGIDTATSILKSNE